MKLSFQPLLFCWSRSEALAQACLVTLLIASPSLGRSELINQGLAVTVPNGYANIEVSDLQVQTTVGPVKWTRVWNGQEWKFNPQWESLSQSWKNLTGSQSDSTTGTAGTAPSVDNQPLSAGGGGGSSCWVWVDEDWSPSPSGETVLVGGVLPMAPMLPERMAPFNRIMGDSSTEYVPPRRVGIDYANLCMGYALKAGSQSTGELEAVRRINELYLGEAGRYAFNNRSILEKRSVKQLPALVSAAMHAALSSGNFSLNPVINEKGYRWIDRSGEWIDYNTQGQIVSWGDKNGNVVWLARDTDGYVQGVVDGSGRVVYSLHYNEFKLIAEVRDYAQNPQDLAARTIKYQYDDKRRLVKIIDARGFATKYEYNVGNRITKVTDPEGREEELSYAGDTVKERMAPDGAITAYVFEYDDVNKQFFSKITGPETPEGRHIQEFTHNRAGKLVRRIVNGRVDEEVLYDTGARSTVVTNARGFSTRTVSNEFDEIVEIEYADKSVEKIEYSASDLQVVGRTEKNGSKRKYFYDSKGNLIKEIKAFGLPEQHVIEYEVNGLGQTTKIIERGRVEFDGRITADALWLLSYDALGQIENITDPEGNTTLYTYNRAGVLTKISRPNGQTTEYEVDALGTVKAVVGALGRVERTGHDKIGNPVSYTDGRGATRLATYDSMDRPETFTNAVGGVQRRQYNRYGLLSSQSDEDGRLMSYGYDNFLRKVSETDALGNRIEYSFDIGSSPGGMLSPVDIKTPAFNRQFRFDELERVTSITTTWKDGSVLKSQSLSTGYDKAGLPTTERDGYEKSSLNSYNAHGAIVDRTDRLGGKTLYKYDARGNLIELVDAKAQAQRFFYDRNNRLTKEIAPEGQVTEYRYDSVGEIIEKLNPGGSRIKYEYDAANRLTTETHYSATGSLSRTVNYDWDLADNLVGWDDTQAGSGSVEKVSSIITYDDEGRKKSETLHYPVFAGSPYSVTYEYRYSLAGKKIGVVWPDGTLIKYGYTDHGQVDSVDLPGEGIIQMSLFNWYKPTRLVLPGGGRREIEYNGLLNVRSVSAHSANDSVTFAIINNYGQEQELIQSNRSDVFAGLSTNRISKYSYDDELRLKKLLIENGSEQSLDSEDFTLDAVGNRQKHSRNGSAWIYNANNQLLSKGSEKDYYYDDSGNLVREDQGGSVIRRLTYDESNRLVRVNNGAGDIVAKYGYDPMNRRIWKEQYRDSGGNPLSQLQRIYYIYSDEGIVGESVQKIVLQSDGHVVPDGPPSISTQYAFYPDSPFMSHALLVKAKATDGSDLVAYYQNDHLNVPVQAVDKMGRVVWSAIYEAFGRAIVNTPSSSQYGPTIDSNIRLPGQYFDTETGLHYNHNRYYAPDDGRYISRDPAGLSGGVNGYIYANGNPALFVDPNGLKGTAGLCLAACAAEEFGVEGIVGGALGVSGLPIIPKKFAPPGASSNTSPLSQVLSKNKTKMPINPVTGNRSWPAPTLRNLGSRTANMGRFLGRWLPGIGWAMLAYDAVQIGRCTAKCVEETCAR